MKKNILARGQVGPEVQELQSKLIALGYAKQLGKYKDDGIFGSATESAVRDFQRDHHLDGVDAVVGKETWLQIDRLIKQKFPGFDNQASQKTRKMASEPPSVKPDSSLSSVDNGDFIGDKIIAQAKLYLNKGEIGADNSGPEVALFKTVTGSKVLGAAWCADFASYVLEMVNPDLIKPTFLAKGLMAQFQKKGAFHSVTENYNPQIGDLVFFERGNLKWQGHVGFIAKIEANGNIVTLEGNKSAPQFKGKIEGIDYEWSANVPDKVRQVTYTPSEFHDARPIGFGSVQEMEIGATSSLPPKHLTKNISSDRS